MGYKALYRKYRPITFEQVKGQDHIVKTLKNIIESDKIGHAYIFSGPRGVGKTSVAKIFANVVNCSHSKEKFMACPNCLADINSNIDVIEMDAASNNGVDDIRDLKEKIELLPSTGRFKVYIIDEVHMLSKGAFNALLKTLEEPPEHAIFILATTDPQKIPLTILSRSQRFNFRRIPNKVLVQQIKDVLDSEKISYENETLNYISKLASGGMRDGLSIADQSSMYGLGKIKLEDIMNLFGVTSNDNLIRLINASYQGNVPEVISIFSNLRDLGIDAMQFVSNLIDVSKDWMVFAATNNENLLETVTIEEVKLINVDPQFIKLYIENLYKLLTDLGRANSPYQLIEFSLIKFVNQKPKLQTQKVQSNYDTGELVKKPIQQVAENKPVEDKKPQIIAENRDPEPISFKNQNFEPENPVFFETKKPVTKAKTKKVSEQKVTHEFALDNGDAPEYNAAPVVDDFFEINKLQPVVTEEIELVKSQPKKVKQAAEKPSSFNLFATLINSEQTPKVEEKVDVKFKDIFTVEDVINSMLQSLLPYVQKYKSALSSSPLVVEMDSSLEEQDKVFANVKILCANENYMVIHSKNEAILSKIAEERNNAWMQIYIKRIFGGYKTIMPVSSKIYKEATEKLKALKKNRETLPQAITIEPPKEIKEDDTALKNGKTIFGKSAKLKK